MRGVTILESGGATTNRRILNPAQGLESGRVGREVRVMTCITTGMTHSIVARQECDISVSHLYKWALSVINRQGM